MRPIVSVIIPLYNGAQYITNCLESVRRQKFKTIEIIIVNDGSTDCSLSVINKYQLNYGKEILINVINQKNQGQGASRNTGIVNAHGKYMMFIDQDDTLADGILNIMVAKAEKEKSDIVESGYRRVTKDGKVTAKVTLTNVEWSKYKVVAPWSKLYRTEFIMKNNARFLPVILGEDVYFLMQLYSFQPKVDFLEEIGYNWLDNERSVSNTLYKSIGTKTSLIPLFDSLECLEQKKNLQKDKMYEYFLIKTAVWNILYTLRGNSYFATLNNSKQIWEWFNRCFPDYVSNPYIRIMKPKGEQFKIRLIVWGYMLIKQVSLEWLFLRIFCKKRELLNE